MIHDHLLDALMVDSVSGLPANGGRAHDGRSACSTSCLGTMFFVEGVPGCNAKVLPSTRGQGLMI